MNGLWIGNIALTRLFLSTLLLPVSQLANQSKAHSNLQRTAEVSHNMTIDINIAGKILTAKLVDNETARDFVSLLPLHMSMNDLFGREKYGNLPKGPSRNSASSTRYQVGDIGYWSPNHQVAVITDRMESRSVARHHTPCQDRVRSRGV